VYMYIMPDDACKHASVQSTTTAPSRKESAKERVSLYCFCQRRILNPSKVQQLRRPKLGKHADKPLE